VLPSDAAEGLGSFLLAAFGAGLLALVTPCVFPMIPVTLAFFTKQATAKGEGAEAARAGVVRLAATYSLGIVLAFTGIGAVLAATVGAAGANRLAASPWVNLGFAALFVVFALALLEVFELRLPQDCRDDRHRAQARWHPGRARHGVDVCDRRLHLYRAVCGNDSGRGCAGFERRAVVPAHRRHDRLCARARASIFSARPVPRLAGAASPQRRLAFHGEGGNGLSGAGRRPQVFVERRHGLPVEPASAAHVAGFVGADRAAGIVWLLGMLRIGMERRKAGQPWRAASGRGVRRGRAVLLLGLSGRPLGGWTAAFLPPSGYGIGAGANQQALLAGGDELSWHESLETGFAQAKAENKPVFIDFTGYTCTNCRWMEKTSFPTRPCMRSCHSSCASSCTPTMSESAKSTRPTRRRRSGRWGFHFMPCLDRTESRCPPGGPDPPAGSLRGVPPAGARA
jgi:thiol:disulfide interchange protein DsbD